MPPYSTSLGISELDPLDSDQIVDWSADLIEVYNADATLGRKNQHVSLDEVFKHKVTLTDAGHLVFKGGDTVRLDHNIGSLSLIGATGQAGGASVEVFGDSHATTPGQVEARIKGTGSFKVTTAAFGSTVATTKLAVNSSGTVAITQGTITAAAPAIDASSTWNNVAVPFTAVKVNVTDTASDPASLLLDLQVGGVSKFSVDKSGNVTGNITINNDRLVLTQGTITDPATMIDGSVTWNDVADTFTAWKLNVTNTASAPASLLTDIQVGGTSVLALRVDGRLTLVGRHSSTTTSSLGHVFSVSDTNTASSVLVATLNHSLSSGTPAAGMGVILDFAIDSTTTAATRAARWSTVWTDATHATRTAATTLNTFVSGTETVHMVLAGGQVGVNPGSVGVPSVANRNDTNTGFYFSAADELSITTGGVQRVFVSSVGQLAVLNPSNLSSSLVVNGSTVRLRLGTSASQGVLEAVNLAESAYQAVVVGGSTVGFQSGGTYRLFISAAGLISIGASITPSANLDVNNLGTATKLYIYRTTDGTASPTDYARLALDTTASATATYIRTEAGGSGLTAGQPRILQVGTGPSVGTNIAGQNVIWHAGQGTGTGAGGSHLFQVAKAGGSGSSANALSTAMSIDGSGNVTVGDGTANIVFRSWSNGLLHFAATNAAAASFYWSVTSGATPSMFFVNNGGTVVETITNAGLVSFGPSATPGANLDVNNSTTTTKAYLYHTTDGAASPTNYSRITLSHTAAATGRQTANFLAETGGTGAANIDIRLRPVGVGGLYLGSTADGTVVGGNARGDKSVDLQVDRAAATEVASGQNSVVLGGGGNTASGSYSFVAGLFCSATTTAASASGYAAVSNKYGQRSQASGPFVANGDAQTSVLVARRQTTDGTANVELFLDGAGAAQRCTIATDTTWGFLIMLVARRTDTNGDYATWEIKGGLSNDAGTTALNSAVTVIQTSVSAGAATWAATVVADNTNDSLKIQVTGEAAKTINWVAQITLVETTG